MRVKIITCALLLICQGVFAQNCIAPEPTVQEATVCYNTRATLTVQSNADTFEWYDAESGGTLVNNTSTFITPQLTQTTIYYVTVTVGECVSPRKPVRVTVNPPTDPPVVAGVTICSGSFTTLTATGPGESFEWFAAPAGGQRLILSPDFTTPNLTATTTYYVQTTVGGCVSARAPVTVTVNPIPAAPTASGTTICAGSSTTLSATAAEGTIQWFSPQGALVGTGPQFTTPALSSTTTYTVITTNGGCGSSAVRVTVTVNPIPAAPSASGAIVCSGSSTTLSAFAPGGNYRWYDAASGGNLLANGATLTTGALTATTTYYVETTIGGCTGPRSAVRVTVKPATAPPAAAGTSICSGNSATLTASGSTGTYAWYSAAAGGTLLSSADSYITPALTTSTTYYVETTVDGCTSTRTPVTVAINPPPAPPVAADKQTCAGTPATLNASAPAGTIEWYDAASGGTLLFSGANYTTPPVNTATTYYVQVTNGQCPSARTAVTVSPYSTDPDFHYSSGTYLNTGTDPTPTILNPSAGTFVASPGGLVIDPATGRIDLSASAPGTYSISLSGTPCPQPVTVTITTTSVTGFSYDGPFCQFGTNPLPQFPPGSSAGSFTATPSGLVFIDAATGRIDLQNSLPGTYTVTNTVPGGTSSSTTVIVNTAPVVNTGPDQTVAAGAAVNLSGTSSPGTVHWTTNGTGSFSNPDVLNPTYTPGPGELNATLTLTYTGATACPVTPDQMTVDVISNPVVNGTSICYNSTGTLIATAPGGDYEWFLAASGGNPIATGPTLTVNSLTSTTTYYVQTTLSGVTTRRVPATITVAPGNPPPTANPVTICYGNTAILNASGADAYRWYDAASGGNLLSQDPSYTTPSLIANATFYVAGLVNGCLGDRVPVNVTVNPLPRVNSASSNAICSGTGFTYTITGVAVPGGTTFTWSRAAVTGITNSQGDLSLSGQTGNTISEVLISTNIVPTQVTYVIIPVANGCPGAAFNYVVTVNPVPVATSSASGTICNNSATNYAVQYNVAGTGSITWSRAAVAGIANAAISGQRASPIRETLINNTAFQRTVTYVFQASTSTCAAQTFSYTVTVNPTVTVTSARFGTVCSGTPQNYEITANNPVTTFTWRRDAVPGISNPAVSGQTTSTISEVLTSTLTVPVQVSYVITTSAYGCSGNTFIYRTTVYPQPATPVISSNTPVCTGSDIQLSTPSVEDATYLWTGPNAFTSTLQNPVIPGAAQANAGAYHLIVTVNNCLSASATANVFVTIPPLASAGPDQRVCAGAASIQLAGNISGGTTEGVWSGSGTGTFSPSASVLNALYIPSDADRQLASLTLTLTSVNNGNCPPASSSMQVLLQAQPLVQAGPDQDVCSQNLAVYLNGTITNASAAAWATSGDGTFLPSNTTLDAVYAPGPADIEKGSATLSLTSTAIGFCGAFTDAMVVRFIPPPIVSAGPDRLVLKGKTIVLQPTSSDANVQYLWMPNVNLNDNKVKNPVFTAVDDQTYTLTITDSRGCVNSDEIAIKVLDPVTIPNTFTPNGDGINDVWNIPALLKYPSPRLTVYTRYGEPVYHTDSYNEGWNGYYKGSLLPVGTYYYVIESHFDGQIYSGWVAIVR